MIKPLQANKVNKLINFTYNKHINALQILRAIAALMVVACHSQLAINTTINNYWIFGDAQYRSSHYPSIINHLDLGVDLFFCISGFIMYMLAINSVPKFKESIKFILNRAIRILPLYWIFTAIVIAIFVMSKGKYNVGQLSGILPSDFNRLIHSILLIPQPNTPILGVGWTLIHETLFYIFCAFIIFIKLNRRFLEILFAVSILSIILATQDIQFLYGYLFSPYYLEFFIGALSYKLTNNKIIFPELFIILGIFSFVASSYILDSLALVDIAFMARQLCGSITGFMLIVGLIGLDRKYLISNKLVGKFLMRIGDASYSLYLMHWFILSAMGKIIGFYSDVPVVIIILWHLFSIMLAIFLAILFAEKVELPLHHKLKSLLQKRLN